MSANNNKLDHIKSSLDELTPEERAEIAKDLFRTADSATRAEITTEGFKDMPRGRLPFELFKAVAWRTVVPTYEAVVVRPAQEDESIEILLKQRVNENGKQDWWEGQWHVPGTVMLASDEWPEDYEDFSIIRNRLFAKEFGGAVEIVGAPLTLPTVLRQGDRGKEVTAREMMYGQIVAGKELPEHTRFFEVRHVLAYPPDGGLVDTHDLLISQVADKFMNGHGFEIAE